MSLNKSNVMNALRILKLPAPLACMAAVMAIETSGLAAETTSPPAATATSATVKKVAVIADSALGEPGQYGIRKLETALRAKGITVSEGQDQASQSDFVLLAGLGAGNNTAAAALAEMKVPAPSGSEALTIRTGARYHEKPAIILAGSDNTGLMYAALDLADRVGWTSNGANPFQFAQDVTESPYLKERGVVMFTMNRAYFESHLYDEQFWVRYFDMLAKDRFNRLVLVFGYEDGGYMAPLYPYFFDVDGFPDVHVVGLTPEQQARNLKAFKKMIRLATERGIHVKPGIWDHIYRGGIQAGGIPGASNGRTPAPGLVWGLNATNLVPYTVAALKKFYETFPEITETQFRMHEESGLRVSEIPSFWHDVFGFYRTNKPDMHAGTAGQEPAQIRDQGCPGTGPQHRAGYENLDGADGPALSLHPHQPREPDERPPKLRGPAGISANLSHELDPVGRRHDAGPAVVRSRLRAPARRQRPPVRWPKSGRDGNGGDQNARGASRCEADGIF